MQNNQIKCPIFNDDYMNEYDQMTEDERKKYGAIWTPPKIISEMMCCGYKTQKDFDDFWSDPNKTVLDPTAGAGNIIVCMILNKLYHGVSPTMAIKNSYAIELQQKNVDICRKRILKIVGDTPEHRKIVNHNIVCCDFFLWDIENWRKKTDAEIRELAKTDKMYRKYVK